MSKWKRKVERGIEGSYVESSRQDSHYRRGEKILIQKSKHLASGHRHIQNEAMNKPSITKISIYWLLN